MTYRFYITWPTRRPHADGSGGARAGRSLYRHVPANTTREDLVEIGDNLAVAFARNNIDHLKNCAYCHAIAAFQLTADPRAGSQPVAADCAVCEGTYPVLVPRAALTLELSREVLGISNRKFTTELCNLALARAAKRQKVGDDRAASVAASIPLAHQVA